MPELQARQVIIVAWLKDKFWVLLLAALMILSLSACDNKDRIEVAGKDISFWAGLSRADAEKESVDRYQYPIGGGTVKIKVSADDPRNVYYVTTFGTDSWDTVFEMMKNLETEKVSLSAREIDNDQLFYGITFSGTNSLSGERKKESVSWLFFNDFSYVAPCFDGHNISFDNVYKVKDPQAVKTVFVQTIAPVFADLDGGLYLD